MIIDTITHIQSLATGNSFQRRFQILCIIFHVQIWSLWNNADIS